MRWFWVLAMVWAMTACGDPDNDPPPIDGEPDMVDPNPVPEPEEPPGGLAVLSNGVTVESEDGVRLTVDDRAFVAMEKQPVRSLTYTESHFGPLGIWDFTRTDEVRATFEGRHTFSADQDRVTMLWPGDEGGAKMTVEPGPTPSTTRVTVDVEGLDYNSIEVAFVCSESSAFYGFGEQYNAVDQRGESFELFLNEQGVGRNGNNRFLTGDLHTSYFPMAWWIDPEKRAAVLFETPYRTLVNLCDNDQGEARIEVTGGQPVTFLVFRSETVLGLVEALSEVVGRPKQPPEWAFEAPWISAQGGSDAVRGFIAQLDDNDIPYSAIWSQDWTGVRINPGGGKGVEYRWEADLGHYPDLTQLVDELHANGKRFLAYANPFIDPNLPNHHAEMAQQGLLIKTANGEPYDFVAPNNLSSHPDFTNPATQVYVEAALEAMVNEHGIDGWMADFGEWTPLDAVFADGSDPFAVHNTFPLQWHAANRAALDRVRPDGDWVTIARSGWTGVHAHTTIHWIGDQEATWTVEDGLPTVVPAMVNLGLAGIPYVTHDIGGFSGGPSTKELYLRWIELGAFTPIMRTHEGNERDRNHNWNTDAETLAHFRRFARIHSALMPEWQALADEANATSAPIVRAMVLHYPDDPEARALSDQYLIGEDLLVAPITTEGAVERSVYLPEGQWFHVFTGEAFEGPIRAMIDAPIGAPPVFSRGIDRPDLRAIE